MLGRLITTVLDGVQFPPIEIMIVGDSESTISTVEADHRVLYIWFTNRVADYLDNESDWRTRGIDVFPVQHWPGLQNIADIATKGLATLDDVQEDSEWQNGPEIAQFPREQWPISRDFVREIPENLISNCYAVVEANTVEIHNFYCRGGSQSP